jgi:four helix bundle protein
MDGQLNIAHNESQGLEEIPTSNLKAQLNNQTPSTKIQTISKDPIINNQTGTNERKSFDLEERTTNFAKGVIVLCKRLDRNSINMPLITQIVRSSGSVGANYREANDALSKKDFVHRMKITRKESKETIHWLILIRTSNPRFGNEIDLLIKEAQELKNIFSSVINKSS